MAKDSKRKIWEKERRDHLKEAFIKLEKLLPSYDPSNAASRIDVITKSIEYIEEMRNIIQELLKPHSEVNPKVLKLKNLQDRIKRLVGRMEILSRLLREAKIPIPQAHRWKEFKQKNRKWSGKLENKSSILKDKVNEKNKQEQADENLNEGNSTLMRNSPMKSKSNPSSLVPKHRKNIVNRVKTEAGTKQKSLQPTTSNCVIIYTQAYNAPPCYLVNSGPSNNLAGTSKTVITNSLVASNPVMATNVKGSKKAVMDSSKIQPIGTGTLILTNGNLYPVLPQPQPILSTPMLLQVTNNSNATIKSDSDKKNENVNGKTVKSPKKNIKKSPKSNQPNQSNTVRKISIPDVRTTSNVISCGPNLVMSKNSQVLTAPMGKLPILPNIFAPKVPATISRKRVKGRRIGDKPVSRQALKGIRKMNKKIETEENESAPKKMKMDNSSADSTNSVKDPVDSGSNAVIPELTSSEKLNSVKEVDDSKVQTTISIIGDDVVKASNQNICSDVGNTSEMTPSLKQTHFEISEGHNLLSNVTNNTSAESHTAEKAGTKNLNSNISEIDVRTSVPAKPPLLNSSNEIELKNMVENSEKAKLPEKSEKTEDEPKPDGPTSGQHMNDEQNMRTDSNLDLDNVCSMNQQLNIHLGHSELSNDIFASLQVPTGCQNPESTSPTAAFLLAFPLVSSLTGVKVTEVMDEDNPDSQRETPTLLQIGNMDATKSTQSENFTPNLLNLDFFSSKDIYSGFYNSFEQHLSGLLPSTVSDSPKVSVKNTSSKFGDNFRTSSLIDNIQPSKQTEMIVQTSKVQENSEVPNNRQISTEIECQPNFSFVPKQSNTVSTNRDRSNHISPPMLYLEKPLVQGVSEKDTNISNCESMDVEKQKVEKVSVRNDQSNISKNNSSKVESSNKDNEKIFRNIMKGDTCQNIFNIGNINNDMNKTVGQIDNINFYPDKNKPAVSRDFHLQNSTNKNIQGLFPDNLQETQLTYTANRNFLSTSMNFNEQNTSFGINSNASFAPKSMNVKNFNQQIDSSQKAVINPYFIPDNKNYGISNSNSNKTVDNRIPENQKYFTYDNFNVDSKKSLKTIEINSNYSVGNKIPPPVSKMVETKQITSNYAANYTNSTYDITNITKVCTCVYISNKPTSEPLYTNSNINNYNYYSNTENYLNDSCYKNVKNDKNVATDSENYTSYKKTDFNSTYYPDLRKNTVTTSKSESTQEKSTYNWMTTPTKTTSNHTVPSYSKDDMIYSNSNLVNSNQTSYFNSTSMYSNDLNTNLGQSTKKTFDLPLVNMNYQKPEVEESQNQFTWSPTKMPQFLDPVPSFVSSTLPTLVGDLALGSSNFTDQKYDFLNKTAKETKVKPSTKMGYENQNNFFSVSQLVHTNDKPASVKTVRRRNSGNGNKNNQTKNKKIIKNNEETKEISQCYNKSPGSQGNSKIENKNFNCRQTNNNSFCDKRSSVKVSSSIYSAESLIGHQGHSEQDSKKDQSFSGNPMKNIPVPPYIPDNIMPYFPPVDLQQDNIMQQNQNYQNFPNFTTFSNNSYSSNSFIPSSTITTPYLSSSTFVPDIGVGNEYSSENINLFPNSTMNKIKIGTKNNTGHREDKNVHNNLCTDGVMKKKKKSANEIQSTTNLVDFSFLSVPGSINSPLLPDDFHSHSTFLPPPPTQPQLYPCKNTLYTPKQSTMTSTAPLLPLPPIPSVSRSVVHPEISPSLNSAGTSLTNFNLSTIFPEINKSSIGDIYSDNQGKEPSSDRHYPNSSVPFNAKSTFTYPNGPITQPYGIDNR